MLLQQSDPNGDRFLAGKKAKEERFFERDGMKRKKKNYENCFELSNKKKEALPVNGHLARIIPNLSWCKSPLYYVSCVCVIFYDYTNCNENSSFFRYVCSPASEIPICTWWTDKMTEFPLVWFHQPINKLSQKWK